MRWSAVTGYGWECAALPEPLNPRVPSQEVQPEGVRHQPGAVSAGLEPNAGRSSRDTAILAGSAFLKQQLRAGHWSLSCHGSDGTPRFSHQKGHLFSAFFISQALDGGLDETERTLLLVRLLSEEAGGLWGYSPRGYAPGPDDNPHFVDADDTAFALRTLRQLGVYRSPKSLLHFLRRRWRWTAAGLRRDGGFVTFPTSKRPVLACQASHAANFDMHAEINANVFHALLDTNEQKHISADLIARSQAADGSWHSFFYPSKFYSSCHFMELIQRLDGFQPQSEKCLRFLTTTQNTDGSWGDAGNPYETALAVKAFASHAPGAGEVSRGLDFLVAAQNDDGSWHSDNVIWESRSDAADIWRSRDVNHVIATSLCVAALRCRA
jgi:hypothetical protein